jgi:hypothetical protein
MTFKVIESKLRKEEINVVYTYKYDDCGNFIQNFFLK